MMMAWCTIILIARSTLRALLSTLIVHFPPLSHQGDQRFRLECACVTIHNGQDSYLIMVHGSTKKCCVYSKKPGDNGYWCWAVICHLSRLLLRMRWTRFFSFIVLSSSAIALLDDYCAASAWIIYRLAPLHWQKGNTLLGSRQKS